MDVIKIDKSFVDDLSAPGGGKRDLAEAIVRSSQAIHLPSVAEGIETEHQVEQLRALGCEYGQGYLFSPPLTVAATRVWLQREGAASLSPRATR